MKKHHEVSCLLILILITSLLSGCNNSQSMNDSEVNGKPADEPSSIHTDSTDELSKDMQSETDSKKNVIKLYLSADQTVSKSSGRSIEQGINVALSEIDFMIHGQPIEVVILDHKGSSPRAKQHLDDFLEDDQALLVYSGLHSPPVLDNRDFINENGILMLDPWAAAGPITRYPSEENWIFRLSVDDTKAGAFITEYALNEGYDNPYLILEDTGWGRSNQKTMSAALRERGYAVAGLEWFNWSLGINQAKFILRNAAESGADVIFFVGNAPEGKVFAEAMTQLQVSDRLPIRSHWGITGGDFAEVVHSGIRSEINLKFLQTRFSFLEAGQHPISESVLLAAYNHYPGELKIPSDIEAPTGFIHAYDLTKLMIKAMEQVDPSLSTKEKRSALRVALENIEDPVQGLVKLYLRPFSVYSDSNTDAHEALGIEDLSMAIYGDENQIILVR